MVETVTRDSSLRPNPAPLLHCDHRGDSRFVGIRIHADQRPLEAQCHREGSGFIRRGLPGRGHAALRGLEGDWRVEKALYIAVGTREKPAVSSDLIARRHWIAGRRFLHDVTEGSIAGGPYYRMGVLGYSNEDARYEFVTVDGMNANMMIYRSDPVKGAEHSDAARHFAISMSGTFTDQGLISEQTAGLVIAQRTVIRIPSDDRHEIDLYFTPPGRAEMLIDHSIYTRIRP
jgi:Protein of unknown function (DUF1579)